MKVSEIKALVSLLDDSDQEVTNIVHTEINKLGEAVIPFLEEEWEGHEDNPPLQEKIENIIHDMQYRTFVDGLLSWRDHRQHDLLEGMYLVAKYQYPNLDFQQIKLAINQLYFDAWLQLRDEIHPDDAVKTLNHIFFNIHGYMANTKSFHSPANSMINQVMDTKRGNPISLCVIYMLVAQRLGLPIFGVNLPNIFVLTFKNPQTQFYINVFNSGQIYYKKDIDLHLKQLQIDPNERFYEPCSNMEIIRRTLLNLMVAFKKTDEQERVAELNSIYDKLIE